MVSFGLLTRRRFREVPPRVEVELTDAGRELLPIAGALARWGMSRMWSAPCDDEHVDAVVLVSLLPVLLEDETGLPDASVRMTILRPDGLIGYRFVIKDGGLCDSDDVATGGGTTAVTAGVEGCEAAWVAAFAPGRDYSGLRFSGEAQLGERILDALPGHPPRPHAVAA
jgi:hypothetical protein